MKVLLDEHLPQLLRQEIHGHQVMTVGYMGWSGIENGELLRRAASRQFGAFVTNDHGLEYEQNLVNLPIAVVLLNSEANTIESVRLRLPLLIETLANLSPCQFVKLA
jgi:hypothetical protein